MASELGANAATLGRLRTTRENRVTPLPPLTIPLDKSTKFTHSHSTDDELFAPALKLERLADAKNSKRVTRTRSGNGNIVLLPFKTLSRYYSYRREKEREKYFEKGVKTRRLLHISHNIGKIY